MALLPLLPKTIQGLGGEIRIDRPLQVEPGDSDFLGMWLSHEDRILIKSTLRRDVAWRMLLHELTHAAIDHAGITLSATKEELICDTVASGMMHVVRHLVSAQILKTPGG